VSTLSLHIESTESIIIDCNSSVSLGQEWILFTTKWN